MTGQSKEEQENQDEKQLTSLEGHKWTASREGVVGVKEGCTQQPMMRQCECQHCILAQLVGRSGYSRQQ